MLQSNRLQYRMMDENDFELYRELYMDSRVMQYTFLDEISTLEEVKKVFDEIMDFQNRSDKGTQYVVERIDNQMPVGIVDYEIEIQSGNSGIFEIGYCVLPNQQKQGFGFEMSRALTDYLFTHFEIHKISGHCHAKNTGSKAILEKLGMRLEGINRKARYKCSQWDDELMFGLLREEWEAFQK